MTPASARSPPKAPTPGTSWRTSRSFSVVDDGAGGRRLERRLRYALDSGGSLLHEEVVVAVVDTAALGRPPVPRDARDACEAFDPALLRWDCVPGNERDRPDDPSPVWSGLPVRPCPSVVVAADRPDRWTAQCAAHGRSLHEPVFPDPATAAALFVCDRGRHRTYLLDHCGTDDPSRPPELTSLTGLARGVVLAVRNGHLGLHGPHLYLHLRPGILHALTVRAAAGQGAATSTDGRAWHGRWEAVLPAQDGAVEVVHVIIDVPVVNPS